MKLRKMLDEATEGPWKADGSFDERGFVVSGPIEGGPNGGQFKRAWTRWGVDADLIAALRNAAPDLLRVVEAVASKDPLGEVHGACMTCRWCGALGSREELKHADDCEWSTARKLVGGPTSRT